MLLILNGNIVLQKDRYSVLLLLYELHHTALLYKEYQFLLYVSVCLYAGLPGQAFAADRASSYVLDMAGVVATVALVPFALGYIGRRLGQKVQAEKSLPDAIRVYRLWSLVRMAVLFAVVSYNLVVYTLSSSDNSIGILCAIIGFISYFLVMPTDRKVRSDLDIELTD